MNDRKGFQDTELNWLLDFNNIDFAKEMAAALIDEINIDTNELVVQVKNKNWLMVEKVAHRIKGSVAIIGFKKLSRDAQVLQEAVKEHQYNKIQVYSTDLIKELDDLAEKVNNWLCKYN